LRSLSPREIDDLMEKSDINDAESGLRVEGIDITSPVIDQLRKGDIILQAEGLDVATPQDVLKPLIDARKNNRGVFMLIVRPGPQEPVVRHILVKPERGGEAM
jgi:hypothetical protein